MTPKTKLRTPTYCFHRPTGQSYVRLGGKVIYLGRYDTPESRAKYDALVSRWLASGRKLDAPGPADLTVVEALALAWEHLQAYYAHDGSELHKFKMLVAIVRDLFGPQPVASFGPLAVKAVRQVLIDRGHARGHINHQIGRLKRLFRWLAENEHIPASVVDAIDKVSELRKGRGGRETAKVKALPDDILEATLRHAPPMVAAMARLQRATGMRAGELVLLRGADLDMSGETWLYTPERHKSAHLDYPRQIAIGPQGQSILRPWLLGDATAHVFSPRRSMELVRAARTAARKIPAGHGNAPGTNRVRFPERVPHERYTVASYRRAIHYACDHAFPPPDTLSEADAKAWRADHRWGTHRLRHAYATEARRMGFSLEVIRAALGHKGVQVTTLYAEADLTKAQDIARKIG